MFFVFRWRLRSHYQGLVVLLTLLLALIGVLCFTYTNLRFCYHVMSHGLYKDLCARYRKHEYSGDLCQELCSTTQQTFKDFQCPEHDMKTTIFTASKDSDVYSIKLARPIRDDLTWTDSEGRLRYPAIGDFYHIVKMHITLTYNVTLDDNMIEALVNQEIDKHSPPQMLSFWRLFNDNNYMMGKLFDEDYLFPSVLASCGPYYATETIVTDTINTWKTRLDLSIRIFEYLFHLEEIKPEPLRMCRMQANLFGWSSDKRFRIKYQSAEHVYTESQIDKMLSDGSRCDSDDDCSWHLCRGFCHPERKLCLGQQQNNNFQIYCENVLRRPGLFSGLLESSSLVSRSLNSLIDECIRPSKDNQQPGRALAPSKKLSLRLYEQLVHLRKEGRRLNFVGRGQEVEN